MVEVHGVLGSAAGQTEPLRNQAVVVPARNRGVQLVGEREDACGAVGVRFVFGAENGEKGECRRLQVFGNLERERERVRSIQVVSAESPVALKCFWLSRSR